MNKVYIVMESCVYYEDGWEYTDEDVSSIWKSKEKADAAAKALNDAGPEEGTSYLVREFDLQE
jgi:hypothetical protein